MATSDAEQDEAIVQVAEAAGVRVFRGSESDVLDRFYQAAQQHPLDTLVRLTADNPAIDSYYLELAIQHHQATHADYTFTTGLPLGANLEIISQRALSVAWRLAKQPEEREHVTPYLRRHPQQFRVESLALKVDRMLADARLTMDYPSDYALLHTFYTVLSANFGLADVAAVLLQYPWLADINKQNQQIRV